MDKTFKAMLDEHERQARELLAYPDPAVRKRAQEALDEIERTRQRWESAQ